MMRMSDQSRRMSKEASGVGKYEGSMLSGAGVNSPPGFSRCDRRTGLKTPSHVHSISSLAHLERPSFFESSQCVYALVKAYYSPLFNGKSGREAELWRLPPFFGVSRDTILLCRICRKRLNIDDEYLVRYTVILLSMLQCATLQRRKGSHALVSTASPVPPA